MRPRVAALAALVALSCALIAPSTGDQFGAAAFRQLKFLLTDLSCNAAGSCDLAAGTTIGGAIIGTTIGGGAPAAADYLTGTAQGGISGEIVVGATPGGELGGTWASPTIDANVIEELNQSAGETDLRYDATYEGYYYDVDGDSTHDTDGTEDQLDTLTVEVPGDYASIQAALDSDDCKKGSSTANMGCDIIAAPGTYGEKFEVSDASDTTKLQYSIRIGGAGSGGYGAGGTNLCATTFTGDGTANHTVVSLDDALGFVLHDFCIDMDTGAANDPKYGIAIGSSTASTTIGKHGIIENISFFDQGASGGAAILIGNNGGSISDVVFNEFHNLYMHGVRTCIAVNGDQVVGNTFRNIHCVDSTATIGGVSIGSTGGEVKLDDFYFSPDATSQIGINVRNEAIGALQITHPTFEWDKDNGTFILFDDTGNTGAYRATTISGGRFQPQMAASTRHVCIDWNRRGTLNIIGNSFESSNASYTCEIDLNNPDATKSSTVNWIGNDVNWAGTQSDPVVNRTTAGGPLRVNVISKDGLIVCDGAGTGITATSTGCHRVPLNTTSTATPADGSTACDTGDTWLETDVFKFYACTDGATDKWYGIQLVDTP